MRRTSSRAGRSFSGFILVATVPGLLCVRVNCYSFISLGSLENFISGSGQPEQGSVTDTTLARYIGRNNSGTGRQRALSPEFGQVSRVSMWDTVLSGGALRFLEDVHKHEEDGVRKRYERLGLSAGVGTRLKETLIDGGWLEAQIVAVGRTRKVLLRLTTEARRILGVEEAAPRGSIAHEYWKRYYARRFEADGYRVALEAERVGGRVDVLALKKRERVAIEVETGKSDVVGNVKNNLLSKFERIVIVATDDEAMAKVERQLGEAGLLIANRVQVILRDRMGFG